MLIFCYFSCASRAFTLIVSFYIIFYIVKCVTAPWKASFAEEATVNNEWNEMKWNEMKWNEMKWTEMKWNEMNWNEMKWNEMKWRVCVHTFECFECALKNGSHEITLYRGWTLGTPIILVDARFSLAPNRRGGMLRRGISIFAKNA